ncbi:MAG: hypothetical protein KGJ66_11660 [Alphaproteobacteria bacterium]|nr:hypothetical protein [Alphaproteobacteria bacterium]
MEKMLSGIQTAGIGAATQSRPPANQRSTGLALNSDNESLGAELFRARYLYGQSGTRRRLSEFFDNGSAS